MLRNITSTIIGCMPCDKMRLWIATLFWYNWDMKTKTKTIKYNNKTIKLPFKGADYSTTPLEMETVTNPFSGQSIAMPKFAVAVYDVTMGSNLIAESYDSKHGTGTSPAWDDVRKGLDWFRQYFAKEYMVLLD